MPHDTRGALSGFTVVDLTRVLSGPYCTMLLGDMGARVIKIERPDGGDDTRAWGPPFQEGESSYFLSVNRNKESVALDFKDPAGRDILRKLIAQADVLVENFRPGTLERLGFGYEQLAADHPRLVYCSVSGFGQTGPKRELPGYDAVIQAEGGLMSITGDTDGPAYRLGVAIADIASGMFAAHGITLALLAREREGRGQLVDVAMLDSVAALLTYQAGSYFATGRAPQRLGNRHPSIAPYESFAASDGELVLAVGNDTIWRRFCAAIERPDLAADPRFATNPQRVVAREALHALLAPVLQSRTRAEWIDRFQQVQVPCGAVRDVAETLEDTQLAAREMVLEIEHAIAGTLRLVGSPVKLSTTPPSLRQPPPRLGEHTSRVLSELGLAENEQEALRARGVIRA